MKTLILCDRESLDYDGLDLCSQALEAVRGAGGEAREIVLNGDEIKPCRGCFRCWVKTPGVCIITEDGANQAAEAEVGADAVILISRIRYGGYSYDMKSFLDRSIQNISPLFEIVNGEMHHKKRYENFPCIIALGYGKHSERERQTFEALVERNALNMRTKRHFVFTAQDAGEISAAMQGLKDVLAAASANRRGGEGTANRDHASPNTESKQEQSQ
jgi:multimeric flavodoxin WrbA